VLKPFAGAISALQRALDVCLIVATLYAVSMHLDNELGPALAGAALAAVVLYLVIGELMRLYRSWRLSSIDEEFRTLLVAWGAVCAGLIVMAFLAKVSTNYSRLATVVWFLITPAPLLFTRLSVRALLQWARRGGANSRTMALAGAGPMADKVMRQISSAADFGVQVVGVFDDRGRERIRTLGHDDSRLKGTLTDMIDRARRGELDYVVIALPMRAEKKIAELVDRLADTTASVYVIPDLFLFDLMRARLATLGSLPAVSVYESPFDGLNGWLKRAEDLLLVTAFLALAALPMSLIAIGVKVSTRSSVFFRQKRYGLNGRVVEVLKFRTMTSSDDGPEVPQALATDNRVTPFGRFLRSTSLDELPQLFNVLSGEMSLVGPRPHAVAHNEQYRPLIHGYMLRHKVKPGITGWAQINGWRGETDTVAKMRGRLEHDLEYVRNWSLWLDVKILVRTVAAVLSRKNAY
jgi:putative colanic acid biosynthesis UDP-glucose lipid carrier transferase